MLVKIAVWFTGHFICDTVAKSLVRGLNATLFHVDDLNDDRILEHDGHIAYGILRGTASVFQAAKRLGRDWFELDKGYTGANHFDGNYRISYKGTQARWVGNKHPMGIVQDALTLVCPPTPDVCQFFSVDVAKWLHANLSENCIVKFKTDQSKIPWDKIGLVRTFNSSVGWQALRRGIPCVSGSNHSLIGSYYNYVDNGLPINNDDTERLFKYMGKHQFTLKQIEKGSAWQLIERYTAS